MASTSTDLSPPASALDCWLQHINIPPAVIALRAAELRRSAGTSSLPADCIQAAKMEFFECSTPSPNSDEESLRLYAQALKEEDEISWLEYRIEMNSEYPSGFTGWDQIKEPAIYPATLKQCLKLITNSNDIRTWKKVLVKVYERKVAERKRHWPHQNYPETHILGYLRAVSMKRGDSKELEGSKKLEFEKKIKSEKRIEFWKTLECFKGREDSVILEFLTKREPSTSQIGDQIEFWTLAADLAPYCPRFKKLDHPRVKRKQKRDKLRGCLHKQPRNAKSGKFESKKPPGYTPQIEGVVGTA